MNTTEVHTTTKQREQNLTELASRFAPKYHTYPDVLKTMIDRAIGLRIFIAGQNMDCFDPVRHFLHLPGELCQLPLMLSERGEEPVPGLDENLRLAMEYLGGRRALKGPGELVIEPRLQIFRKEVLDSISNAGFYKRANWFLQAVLLSSLYLNPTTELPDLINSLKFIHRVLAEGVSPKIPMVPEVRERLIEAVSDGVIHRVVNKGNRVDVAKYYGVPAEPSKETVLASVLGSDTQEPDISESALHCAACIYEMAVGPVSGSEYSGRGPDAIGNLEGKTPSRSTTSPNLAVRYVINLVKELGGKIE